MSNTYPHDKTTDRPISDTYKEVRVEKNGVEYIGRTYNHTAGPRDANWQIQRHYEKNGEKHKDYAGKAQFNQVWIDREKLFEALDFKNEYSIHLDGINERITLGASHPMDRPKSISVWIKPQRVVSGTIIAKGHENGYLIDEHFIDIQNEKIRVCVAKTPEKVRHVETSKPCLKRDTWCHVVVACDADRVQIWANGEAQEIKVVRNDLGDEKVQEIGDCLLGSKISSDYFYGNMDELLIYDRAVSHEEVENLYNLGQPGKPVGEGLIHWYRLGDYDTFPQVKDDVGGAHGLCQNMEKDDISKETP